MIILSITNVKAFMSQLLVKDTFDHFLLSEATITTYNTFQIDGLIHRDYYTEEQLAALSSQEYSLWQTVRPFCFSLVKGSRTPSYMKLIFQLPASITASLIDDNGLDFTPEDINGLFINIKYEHETLTCTTGSSLRIFTLDKSLDQAFEHYIRDLFVHCSIGFEDEV